MEAQLYSLRASATRLTGKHWAAPYASSLLPRSRARARCGVGVFAPAPIAHVLASRQWCGPGTSCHAAFLLRSPAPCSPTVFRSAICDYLSTDSAFLKFLPVFFQKRAKSFFPKLGALYSQRNSGSAPRTNKYLRFWACYYGSASS